MKTKLVLFPFLSRLARKGLQETRTHMKHIRIAALLAGLVSLFGLTQLQAINLDISTIDNGTTGAGLRFNGGPGDNDTFVFVNNAAGRNFTVALSSGVGDSIGLNGIISGTFTIGPVSVFGGVEMAPVTSSAGAQLIIFDGAATFSGFINWIEIDSMGTSDFLNVGGVINLTGMTYNGTKADLIALAASPGAVATLQFGFVPSRSVSQLKADGAVNFTSFTGDIIGEECTGKIGDFVWDDSASPNGCQDGNEPGIPGVKVELFAGCPPVGNAIRTTNTDAAGKYLFGNLCAGTYSVKFTTPGGFTRTVQGTCGAPGGTPSQDNPLDSDCSKCGVADCNICVTLVGNNGQNLNIDCGYIRTTPCVEVIKTAAVVSAKPFVPVTYTYVVTNCGGTTLNNIVVTDDQGTPSIADDVVIGMIASLPPAGSQTFTKNLIPPVVICSTNTSVASGKIITTIQPNGNVRATFIQAFNVNDNTYGTGSDAGWTAIGKTHKFNDLVGSDKAVWQFKNGNGQVVMQFGQDYIGVTNVSATFPAGYASLGLGGDGGLVTGSASSLVYASSSLAENLNKPPFVNNLAQYTVNSPNANNDWESNMIYTVEITAGTFGASGFGSVSIVSQHNSPGKRSIVNPNPCDACATNVATVTAQVNGTLPVVTIVDIDDARVCVSTNPPPPQFQLFKTASKTVISPLGESVTYTYTVVNNGAVPINNIVVVDDNGTPGNGMDDFIVGGIASLAPGASQNLTATRTVAPPGAGQPIPQCEVRNGTSKQVGTITITDLGASIQVKYSQTNVNDNRYGTGATATTGWPGGHTFGNLTGSDKAQFVFKDANGATVLDFVVDYISQDASAPSGYGTLGFGGDGDAPTVGNAADVLEMRTSLSDNLKLAQFQTGFLVNSPPETSPNSGTSVPAGWDYENSYTVIVSKNAFGAAGFGSVSVPAVHDSPPKDGAGNLVSPTNCTPCVVNIATASSTVPPLTAKASATVCFGTAGGGGGAGCPTAGAVTKASKKVNVPITNNTGSKVTISEIFAQWPNSNGKLMKVTLDGTTIYDTPDVAPPSVTLNSQLVADANKRSINSGATETLTLEFQNNASLPQDLKIKFGSCTIDL